MGGGSKVTTMSGSNDRSSCRPPTNTTYLTIGQDLFSINEYVTSQYNYSLHHYLNGKNRNSTESSVTSHDAPLSGVSSFVPSTYMVYTDLASLKGLWEPTDYGSGVEYADGVLDLFPPITAAKNTEHSRADVGLQIGLWLNGTQGCYSIFTGQMDHQIQLLISYLERSRASKILLRLGYEFDNPQFKYSDDPAMYVLAFRKIVTDCRNSLSDEAKRRVLFVWHSWGAPMGGKGLSLERFYPGDDFVDWVGVSIFQQVYPWSPYWGGKVSDIENVLNFAKKHHKPTVIAESTPFGGIELKQASTDAKFFLANNPHDNTDIWDRWYGKVIDLINKYDISMWCYINCNWESQPMWHNIGFGETRIASNEYIMSKWQEKIINNGIANRTFLASGSLENCGVHDDISETPGGIMDEPIGTSPFARGDFVSETMIFILIPFLVVSGAFYIPYFVLGGHKSRRGISSKRERKPLLSNFNVQSTRGGSANFSDVRSNSGVSQS